MAAEFTAEAEKTVPIEVRVQGRAPVSALIAYNLESLPPMYTIPSEPMEGLATYGCVATATLHTWTPVVAFTPSTLRDLVAMISMSPEVTASEPSIPPEPSADDDHINVPDGV